MRTILCAALVLAAVGCSGTEPETTVPVNITDAGFTPDTISIDASQSVRWRNSGTLAHHIVADSGEFQSGNLAGPTTNTYGNPVAGAAYEFQFQDFGYYDYHCSIHPFMTGTVYVRFGPD